MATPAKTSMNVVGTDLVNEITMGESMATTIMRKPASTAAEYLWSFSPISGPAIMAIVGPPTTALCPPNRELIMVPIPLSTTKLFTGGLYLGFEYAYGLDVPKPTVIWQEE